jgi:glucan phosphoethanolaminetransferase (alkaline phosphatase superfamily)
MTAKSQDTNDNARRYGSIFLGAVLIAVGVVFISTDQIYSTNFLISIIVGPIAIISGFLLSYISIFKWEILRNFKNTKHEKHINTPYIRLLAGALVGFVVFAIPCAILLWRGGWFHRVPCFTPPPGLVLLVFGFLGAVIGALASMFSRKWKTQNAMFPGSDRANYPYYRYKCPNNACFQCLDRPFQGQNQRYKTRSAPGVR